MIDPNKTYRTRDGREVRIYAVEPNGPDPVHGACFDEGVWYSKCWRADGRYWQEGECGADLIESKPPRCVWLNVYPHLVAGYVATDHATREEADADAGLTRTHRIRVTIPDEPVWDE